MRAKDVIYRSLTEDFNSSILSCGFMPKPVRENSQYNYLIDYYSCFIILEGQGTYVDDRGFSYKMAGNMMGQRLPGRYQTTEIVPDGKWLEFYISFGKSVYDYLTELKLLKTDPPIMPIVVDQHMVRRCEMLLNNMKEASSEQLPSLLLQAQQMVIQWHSQTNRETDPHRSALQKAYEYLVSSSDPVDIKELADSVDMGYENFRKQFTQRYGLSPYQLHINQKMNKAKWLLDSGITIKETADLCHYADIYTFSKQFRKSVGITPGAYLRKIER